MLSRAEQLALEAVALAQRTDFLNLHGDALTALAEVFLLAGRGGDAPAPLREAAGLYERKGNVVSAGRASAALPSPQDSTATSPRGD